MKKNNVLMSVWIKEMESFKETHFLALQGVEGGEAIPGSEYFMCAPKKFDVGISIFSDGKKCFSYFGEDYNVKKLNWLPPVYQDINPYERKGMGENLIQILKGVYGGNEQIGFKDLTVVTNDPMNTVDFLENCAGIHTPKDISSIDTYDKFGQILLQNGFEERMEFAKNEKSTQSRNREGILTIEEKSGLMGQYCVDVMEVMEQLNCVNNSLEK